MENIIPTEQPLPTNTSVPEVQPEVEASQPPMEEKKKSFLIPTLLGVAVLILGAIFGMLLRNDLKLKTPAITQNDTLTPTPTLSTNRPLSAIASTSAFLSTESSIASLSAAASALNVNDTTLNPPSLDLPLGLDTK